MMKPLSFLRGESDIFVGKRRRLKRYLVCSLAGYFPVLIKTSANSLAAVFRTGAEHVAISGTLAVSTSPDGGRSWSDPVEITPRGEDSRNPAMGINESGEIIVAFWKAKCHVFKEGPDGWYEDHTVVTKERVGKIPGLFVTRSGDDGRTWTEPQPYLSTLLAYGSPFGRMIAAPDGTLLMPAQGMPREAIPGVTDVNVLIRSRDGGRSWGDETLVSTGHNETSYAVLADATLVAAARSEGGHVAVLFSKDLGRTWSQPVPVTRRGESPADLTVLQSGNLLMTFGRRIRPMGCGALLSGDGGRSWNFDREILLAADGVENADLGYPSTVQLDDGHIVTVLYYASGSEMSADPFTGWGKVSCQAIHYREEDIV